MKLTATSIEQIISTWAGTIFTNFILQQFGDNPENYLLPGAKGFLKEAQQIGKVFGLTANIQPQAEFLMKFVGLANYFDEIVGFPIEIEKNKHHNKKKMLLRLMEKHKLEQRQTCYIGDSASDIKSGQEAGVFTIGIANNYANGAKLIEQGCDLLATSMAAYAEILKWLTSLRKTESVKQAF